MKSPYIITIFVTTIMFACNSDAGSNNDSQCISVTEYDSTYIRSSVPMGDILDVAMFQNIMILKQEAEKDVFLFVDCTTGNVIKTWGRRGHGPQEFIDFGMSVDVCDSTLAFVEWDTRTLHIVNVNDIVTDTNQVRISSQTYPYTRDFRPNKLYRIGRGWLALGYFASSRLGYLTKEMKEVESNVDYPFEHDDISLLFAGTVFQGKAACVGSLGAIITNMSDALEIVSVDSMGNITKTVEVKPTMLPKYSNSYGQLRNLYSENSAGYSDVCADAEYIYILSGGELRYKDFAANGLMSTSIIKYDWNGNLICEYKLPFPVSEICVHGTKLYGIRPNGEDVIIYSFDIEKQKNEISQ